MTVEHLLAEHDSLTASYCEAIKIPDWKRVDEINARLRIVTAELIREAGYRRVLMTFRHDGGKMH